MKLAAVALLAAQALASPDDGGYSRREGVFSANSKFGSPEQCVCRLIRHMLNGATLTATVRGSAGPRGGQNHLPQQCGLPGVDRVILVGPG